MFGFRKSKNVVFDTPETPAAIFGRKQLLANSGNEILLKNVSAAT